MFVQINGIEYDLVFTIFPLKFYSLIKGNNIYKGECLRLKKRFLIIKDFSSMIKQREHDQEFQKRKKKKNLAFLLKKMLILFRVVQESVAEQDNILKATRLLRREKGSNEDQ